MCHKDDNKEIEVKGYNPDTWLQDIYDAVPCGILRFRVNKSEQVLLSANKTALTMSGIDSMETLAAVVKNGFFLSKDDSDLVILRKWIEKGE